MHFSEKPTALLTRVSGKGMRWVAFRSGLSLAKAENAKYRVTAVVSFENILLVAERCRGSKRVFATRQASSIYVLVLIYASPLTSKIVVCPSDVRQIARSRGLIPQWMHISARERKQSTRFQINSCRSNVPFRYFRKPNPSKTCVLTSALYNNCVHREGEVNSCQYW